MEGTFAIDVVVLLLAFELAPAFPHLLALPMFKSVGELPHKLSSLRLFFLAVPILFVVLPVTIILGAIDADRRSGAVAHVLAEFSSVLVAVGPGHHSVGAMPLIVLPGPHLNATISPVHRASAVHAVVLLLSVEYASGLSPRLFALPFLLAIYEGPVLDISVGPRLDASS